MPVRRTAGHRVRVALTALALIVSGLAWMAVSAPAAAAMPFGFQDQLLWSGFNNPTAIAFAPDGKVFVAEKSGSVTRFDSLTDTTGDVIVDLRAEVHNRADRGLLGLAVDPNFGPSRPYIYVQYTYDHVLGSTTSPPRWGTTTSSYDDCPSPPGDTDDGCVVSGRVSKLVLSSPTGPVSSEQVLVEDWCEQFPSHSIGTIAFGADGKLYAAGGDGASYNYVDYGQAGGSPGSPTPKNPCGDPPGGVGATLTPPTARGGALRAQAAGIGAKESTTNKMTLSGSLIRIDPDTGLGVAGNPWFSKPGADDNEKRLVAYGFRNPFRFSFRGGTNELWVGDVGWSSTEEVDTVPDPATLTAPLNFGWPCYEGSVRQSGYESAGLDVCTNLYAKGTGAVRMPFYEYQHDQHPVATDGCPIDVGSAIAGAAYYNRPTTPGITPYPARYDGALFFTDYNRRCMWVMLNGANGLPDPSTIEAFASFPGGLVDLVVGPSGDIFYPNLDTGEIHRIRYFPNNVPPVASFTASPSSGPAPLAVHFDASGSSDPDGTTLTYAWDLDGDGQYNDATGVTADRTYAAGTVTVGLRVTDALGASSTTSHVISSGNSAPVVTITSPSPSLTWKVGDAIAFAGSATDPEDGTLAASRLSWLVRLLTCDNTGSNCVTRSEYHYDGTSSGTQIAPDWGGEGNNVLEFALTATDSGGVASTQAVRVLPKNVTLSFTSTPSGLSLGVGTSTGVTPFSRTVILGSTNSLSAPATQTLNGTSYLFSSWSDGGAASHNIVASTTTTTYAATYTATAGPVPVAAYGFNEGTGTAIADSSGSNNNATATNTTWNSAGKYGAALNFNGTSSMVSAADSASLDLTNAMTLEAWVKATAVSGWNTVIMKENPVGPDFVYALEANTPDHGPGGWLNTGPTYAAQTTTLLTLGTWTHLAATYDGATLRFYRNGTLIASTPATGTMTNTAGGLRIGGNTLWGEYFTGAIDEVRIYNRALTGAQITSDMNTPIAGGGGTTDTTPPAATLTAPANGTTVSGTVTLSANATDNVAVAGVQFAVDGANVGSEDTVAPYTTTWDSRTVANGTHTITAVARDTSNNLSAPASVTITVNNTAASGLVAAYGFNEGQGNKVGDSSGAGNNATATKSLWTSSGKYGKALSFNGKSSMVSAPDSASLDLTNAMTLEAWVRPQALAGWNTVIMKENPAGPDFVYALEANTPDNGPGGWLNADATYAAETPTTLTLGVWTHLATTYDGTTLRFYRNGTLISSTPATGTMLNTTGGLRIGGNTLWGEYFTGAIDEVRIYNRALSAAQITTDMNTPI